MATQTTHTIRTNESILREFKDKVYIPRPLVGMTKEQEIAFNQHESKARYLSDWLLQVLTEKDAACERRVGKALEKAAITAWSTGMRLHMRENDVREVCSSAADAIRELKKTL